MNSRKILYAVLILAGIGLAVTFRTARYNDGDLPVWVFVVVIPVFIALMAMDVYSRRKKSGTTPDNEPRGSERNA